MLEELGEKVPLWAIELDGVAGTAVPLTDAASLPTVISIPQA